MTTHKLQPEQVALLRKAHQQTHDRAAADRIKAVILLSEGWESAKVAEALFLDERIVRASFRIFERDGLDGLHAGWSLGLD
jgi:hypothetical protein